MDSLLHQIHYYVDGVKVAYRYRQPSVPRVGDKVRLSGRKLYRVKFVVWVEDASPQGPNFENHVAIDLVLIYRPEWWECEP